MESSFSSSNTTIVCPDCEQLPQFKDGRYKPILICNKRNYSGCSVDIANCEECGHGFQVSYKVDEITRIPKFDAMSRQEMQEIERAAKLEEVKRMQANLDALKLKLGIKEAASHLPEDEND